MIAILAYHAIEDGAPPLATPPAVFADQMRALASLGVPVVPLDEVPALVARAPAARAVALTFDDGFASVARHAVPVLAEHGFPATVFLTTGHLGGTNDWPGQPRGAPRRPLLTWAEVRALGQVGVAFGSHTRTHPDLTRLPDDGVIEELSASRQAIEDATGRPAAALAYPYGLHDARVRALARARFALACGTALAFVTPESDALALPRLDAHYLRRPRRLARLFTPELRVYLRLRAAGRALRERVPGLAWRPHGSGPPGGSREDRA